MVNAAVGGGGRGGGPTFGFPWQPGKHANSLAEAIERQAMSQKRQAREKQIQKMGPPVDPFTALQEQLFSNVNSIQVAPTPVEQLRQMAQSQVGAQFDPMIEALKQQMATRTERAGESMDTAREMYGDLAEDFLAQLPEITNRFNQADKQAENRYDRAQQMLQNQYGQQADQQQELLQQLGLMAAHQESTEQARDDQKYFQGQMELDQQRALNALQQQQGAAETYQRSLGNNSRMAGENTAQDIEAQLQDYLDQAGSQMNVLESQRGSALASLLAQMQQQDAQRVATQEENAFDRMMDMYRFQLDAMNSSARNARSQAGQQDPLSTGLAGASNYLAGAYPDQPVLASNLMEQINDVLSNKNVVRGKFVLDEGDPALGKGPTYSDVGQEYMIDLLRKEFEKEGSRYGPQDVNNTINALLAYMGKLR